MRAYDYKILVDGCIYTGKQQSTSHATSSVAEETNISLIGAQRNSLL
jgi:hypothetical protein